MAKEQTVTYPWNFAANHWLSRSLQVLWAIAIALTIWAVSTGRSDAPLFIAYVAAATILVWAVHIAWQQLRRRSAKESAPVSASNTSLERTRDR